MAKIDARLEAISATFFYDLKSKAASNLGVNYKSFVDFINGNNVSTTISDRIVAGVRMLGSNDKKQIQRGAREILPSIPGGYGSILNALKETTKSKDNSRYMITHLIKSKTGKRNIAKDAGLWEALNNRLRGKRGETPK